MKAICSHYFPWQLIVVMPNWLLIGTTLSESGTRTPTWLCSPLSRPRSCSVSRFLQQTCTTKPWPQARLRPEASHKAGLLTLPASQVWSCESKGRSCAKGPPIKSLALPRFGRARRSYIYENTGKDFQHSHNESGICRS